MKYKIDKPKYLKYMAETTNGERILVDIDSMEIEITDNEIKFHIIPLFEMPKGTKTIKLPHITEAKTYNPKGDK